MAGGSVLQDDIEHILRHTQGVWEQLRDGRVFITGGTGFVGRWLLLSFLAANDRYGLNAQLVALTRDPARFAAQMPAVARHPALTLHAGDVRDFAFPEGRFSAVIHGATDVARSAAPLATFDVAVEGTRRVLELARRSEAADLLLVSSGAIYGKPPAQLPRIPEEYSGAPATTDSASAYGQGKRAAEWLACAYSAGSGPACRIARCFSFVGPHMPLKGLAVGELIGDLVAGRELTVKGDGSALRSYLYAADLAVWLWVILFQGRSGCAYNVGSDLPVSIAELAERLQGFGGAGVRILGQSQPGRAPERYLPDTARAAQELGLRTFIDLDEALARTVAWARASRQQPTPGVEHA